MRTTQRLISVFLILGVLEGRASSGEISLERWQQAVVKVRSSACSTPKISREGSGLLLQKSGRILVLTSEHVVFHESSAKICHQIQDLKGRVYATTLLSADYVSGLAALEVRSADQLKEFSVPYSHTVFQSDLKHDSTEALAMGFPFGARQPQILRQGQVVNTRSSRSLIPGQQYLVETKSLPLEYGMSGGVLLQKDPTTKDGFRFAGVLSHQYLKRQAGRETRLAELNSAMAPTDLGFAIRGADVARWFETKTPRQELPALEWRRDPTAQLEGFEILNYGPLQFQLKNPKTGRLQRSGGADGSGIGGSSARQGNLEPRAEADEELAIEVVLNPAARAELRKLDLGDSDLNAWKERLLRGQSVTIRTMVLESSLETEQVQSLEQFMTLWLRQRNRPVAESKSAIPTALEAQQVKLENLLRAYSRVTRQPLVSARVIEIATQLSLLQSGVVPVRDAERILFGERQLWEALYSEDFQAAVGLETAIRQYLADLLKARLP